MPPRQVQQHTFDAIVREAIQDFGLTAEEAVAEAKDQLGKAGITDFSNISTSSTTTATTDHPAHSLTQALHSLLQQPSPTPAQLCPALEQLSQASATPEGAAVAAQAGALPLVAHSLVLATHVPTSSLPHAACNLAIALAARDEARRVHLVNEDGVLSSLSHLLRDVPASSTEPVMRTIATIQRRSERAKRLIAKEHGLSTIVTLLQHAGSHLQDGASPLFTATCGVLRQLLAHDDFSVEVAETFNRARALAGMRVVTESGLRPMDHQDVVTVLADVTRSIVNEQVDVTPKIRRAVLIDSVLTAWAVCVAEDICKQVWDAGLVVVAVNCALEYVSDVNVVLACVRVMRSVAGHDDCKTELSRQVMSIRSVVSDHIGTDDKLAEAYCGLLGQLVLRRPDIALEMTNCGMMDEVVSIMLNFADKSSVARAACHVIRNGCARQEVCARHLRDGAKAESALRNALKTYPRECDIAYYALREMDVLGDDELRRDTRYKLPAVFH